jgi:hypothetical protein
LPLALVVGWAAVACGGSSAPITPIAPDGDGGADATSSPESGGTDAPAGGSSDAASDGAEAGPTVSATVTVTPSTTVATLPAGMVGLSYEKSHLTDGYFTGDNAALVALFKLLGPQLLRVGGNSVDETTWYTAAAADAGAATIITKADVDGLAAFARAAGWDVLYGVNMKTSNPALAAQETAYASGSLGANLYGFEIGNEVDLYTSTAQSATWSYPIFTTQWQDFEAAIEAATPGAPLTGPASASHYATWTVPFATSEGTHIELLTQHYYRANGQDATSTLTLLLQPDPALLTELKALQASVASPAKGSVGAYRLTECNSFYNGGAPDVSDAFGTALWAIDFLFTNALYGSAGGNFHGGGNGPGYTPIADANGVVVGARPIFYGLLFFTRVGAGTLVGTASTVPATLNFTTYAVEASDKTLNIVLVNKDPTTAVEVTVDAGEAVASASVTRLQAPALDATTGVTLAGAGIDPTGGWSPAAPPALPVSGHTITVEVPPASAALVHAVPQ